MASLGRHSSVLVRGPRQLSAYHFSDLPEIEIDLREIEIDLREIETNLSEIETYLHGRFQTRHS